MFLVFSFISPLPTSLFQDSFNDSELKSQMYAWHLSDTSDFSVQHYKKRAIGWILQLLRGCTASVPHGEHEAPCGPILGMQQHAHRMSVFTYVQA